MRSASGACNPAPVIPPIIHTPSHPAPSFGSITGGGRHTQSLFDRWPPIRTKPNRTEPNQTKDASHPVTRKERRRRDLGAGARPRVRASTQPLMRRDGREIATLQTLAIHTHTAGPAAGCAPGPFRDRARGRRRAWKKSRPIKSRALAAPIPTQIPAQIPAGTGCEKCGHMARPPPVRDRLTPCIMQPKTHTSQQNDASPNV